MGAGANGPVATRVEAAQDGVHTPRVGRHEVEVAAGIGVSVTARPRSRRTGAPSSAAATILTGVTRGRRRILVGADARLLDLTARVTGGPGQHRLVAAATRAIRRPRPSTAT